MPRKVLAWVLLAVGCLCLTPAQASLINLRDWVFVKDGVATTQSSSSALPGVGSLDGRGLGSLAFSFDEPGRHQLVAWFDFEFVAAGNSFFNEYGRAVGTPASGQSWEIDEPGYVFGDIYPHVLTGRLDDTNAAPSVSPDDVSFAIAWDFVLARNEVADVSVSTSASAPGHGTFHLAHSDPVAASSPKLSSVFLSSELSVDPRSPAAVPLVGTLQLTLFGLLMMRRRRRPFAVSRGLLNFLSSRRFSRSARWLPMRLQLP